MSIVNNVLNFLNKVYREDIFVKMFSEALGDVIQSLTSKISELKENFFFDSLNEDGIKFFESLLAIPISNEYKLQDRKSRIQSKWNASNNNTLNLIQQICDNWKKDEITAFFTRGKILLKFIGEFGIPANLGVLSESINEIKPAHIRFLFEYRYLLVKHIHGIKTINEMQATTLNKFAFGKE